MGFIVNPYRYAASSSLLTGLVSWWSMDESSGTRYDNHGSNDLIETGTISSTTGVIGNACAPVTPSTSDYLSCSHTGLDGGERDFTVSAWVNAGTIDGLRGVVQCGTTNLAGDTDYMLLVNASKFTFYVAAGSAWKSVNSGGISVSTTYHVMAWHDDAASTIYISVNNGTPSSAGYTGTPNDVSGTFVVGDYNNLSPGGWIDEVAFWSRLLTADERTELYNSGSGTAYPG